MVPTPAVGVYLSAGRFEAVVSGLARALTSLAGAGVGQSLRTPPVIARSIIERVGYHQAFPHLLGSVVDSDLVLLPAGCYCLYPMFEGARLTTPIEVSIEATCFRQEDSAETGRLRSFRMREFVRLGVGPQCRVWRDDRLTVAREWLGELGLETEAVVANDPFFGSGNRLIRALQREQVLKIELVATVGPGQRQAVASGNYHKEQFGAVFEISEPAGGVAHSACLAFGYERLALALMHRHGDDPWRWPDQVRDMLSLEVRA